MKTAMQDLINKFEEIKDLDFMVQVMIIRGESWRLLEKEKESLSDAFFEGQDGRYTEFDNYYISNFGESNESGI